MYFSPSILLVLVSTIPTLTSAFVVSIPNRPGANAVLRPAASDTANKADAPKAGVLAEQAREVARKKQPGGGKKPPKHTKPTEGQRRAHEHALEPGNRILDAEHKAEQRQKDDEERERQRKLKPICPYIKCSGDGYQ